MSKGMSIFISIIITALITCTATWFYVEDVKTQSYDKGYNKGYDKGYVEGGIDSYEEGYDRGYEIGYQEGNESVSDLGYLTTDTAPAGTVWTTPSGEKYHEGWCRYVGGGRTDLTYFLSAEDAMKHGYAPCSVCH